MIQCSLSELVRLSEIIKAEKNLALSYKSQSEETNDAQLKEKFQKCASIHATNYSSLSRIIKE